MQALENPYAPEKAAALAFRPPTGTNWEALLQKLAGQGNFGAIVGRLGSGKTAALEGLQPYLWKMGFEPRVIRITNETSMREKEALTDTIRKIESPCFLLLDGAEQLSTRLWLPVRSAASKAAGFVITVHRVSRLPIWIECNTNAALLSDLHEELTGEPLPGSVATDLISRHFGNIRACFNELYENWNAREPAGV